MAQFGPTETLAWFEQRGVPLRTEADGRMFPVTNTSQTIIDCFLQEARRLEVEVQTQSPVHALVPDGNTFRLTVGSEKVTADRVIVATGGSPKLSGLDWLANLGHAIAPPVPSLFTFNMPDTPLTALPGLSVERALVRVPGTKLSHDGPLLITPLGHQRTSRAQTIGLGRSGAE